MAVPARVSDPADTLPWPAVADGVADIGVLCVHGIGVQAEGETLLNVARPLLAEFANDGAEVRYGETLVKPLQRLDAGPARMAATVSQGNVRRQMLLAESWWAGVFDPPSYFRLLGWLLTYGTWLAIRHAVFSLSAPIRYLERRYDRAGKPRPDWLSFIDVAIFAYPATLISLFFVALPMQWLLLLVGVVALIPFRATRRLAQQVALAASAILGDASVYTANVVVRQAILTRVRADLEWLAARSKLVVVLAHSQGAAVMYDLLRSIDDLGKLRLVTYGAGIRKLSELEEDSARRPLIVLICGTLWLFGLIFALVAWFAALYTMESLSTPGATAIGDRVGSLLLFYLLAFLVVSTFLYHVARGRDLDVDRRVADEMSSLLRRNLQWSDVYASSDPVPGGPLLGARAMEDAGDGWRVAGRGFEGFRSREVVNLLSTIADHTAYWTIPNDFVPLVARAIRAWARLPAPLPLDTARKRRMVFRKIAGLAIAAAAVAAFWRAGDPLRDLLWRPAWELLPLDPSSITARVVLRYGLRDVAVFFAGLALYVGLAVAYARWVLDPAWNAWERAVQNDLRGGEESPENLVTVLAHIAHQFAPAARFVVCVLAAALPLGLLAGAISRGDYGPAVASVLALGEWGREIVGWIVTLFALLAVVAVVLGVAERVRNWWVGSRGRADGP